MMPSCSFRYSGLALANRRNGSTNSGRSATREMSNAPYFSTILRLTPSDRRSRDAELPARAQGTRGSIAELAEITPPRSTTASTAGCEPPATISTCSERSLVSGDSLRLWRPTASPRDFLSVRSPRTLGARVVVLPLSREGVLPGRRKIAAEQRVVDEDALPSHVVFEFSQ